jgi:hypothetical protein
MMTNSPEAPSDFSLPIGLSEGANKQAAIATSLVQRPSEVDPLELSLHFDVYDCPHCDGGEAKITYPDSDQVDWETCNQCNGEGQLAVRRSRLGFQTEDIEYIKFSLALTEEQCKAILSELGWPSDGLAVEIIGGSTMVTFPQTQSEGDRDD